METKQAKESIPKTLRALVGGFKHVPIHRG